MTVSSTTAKDTYTGDGSTTTFAFTFPILDETHLEVQIKDTNNVVTTKVLTTDYTVTGTGNTVGSTDYQSGNVVFGAGDIPVSTDTVIIKRNVPLKQETDYTENDTFPAETHEDALDKLTMITQQLDEQLDLAIKFDSGVSGFDATLPTPAADLYIGFNSTADGLVAKTVAQLGTITVPVPISDGGTGSTSAATALSALGGIGAATTDTLTNKTLTSPVINTGVSGTAILDEDNMASNSATQLATQQSIKAYVDSQSYDLVLLSTATASASASLTFTSSIDSTYQAYVFLLDNIAPATDGVDLYLRFSTNGGSSYNAGATDYIQASLGVDSGGTARNVTGTQSAVILSSLDIGNSGNEFLGGVVTLIDPAGGGGVQVTMNTFAQDSSVGQASCVGGSRFGASASAVDAVQFLMSSGNIASGTIRMYGMKAS
jgi:hypothetical protein